MKFGINKHDYFLLKTTKIAQARRESAICSLWKNLQVQCSFIPNCRRKIMWLLINNIHEKIRITQSGKNCSINCAIPGARFIWKQKIWLVLTKPYCLLANHNPEFRRVICNGITLLALCYTWTALLSANQNRVMFSCILLLLLLLLL